MAPTLAPLSPTLAEIQQAIRRPVLEAGSRAVIYLEAGHYSGASGADEFSLLSQTHAIDLGKNLIREFQRSVRLVYGILKDDLGLTCDAVSCYIPRPQDTEEENLTLPRNLESLLQAEPLIKMDKLLLFSERNAKNRGLARLKKIRESNSFPPGMALRPQEDGDQIVFTTYDRQEVVLAEAHGARWTAKCPVLMGQHYADVLARLEQRFPAGYPLILVDFSDLMDRNKVGRGTEAALRYFRPANRDSEVTILNVFYDDPEGEGFIVDEYRSRDF